MLPGVKDSQLAFKTEEGKASSDSSIALFNSNQMCSVCDLFYSPFASHKVS